MRDKSVVSVHGVSVYFRCFLHSYARYCLSSIGFNYIAYDPHHLRFLEKAGKTVGRACWYCYKYFTSRIARTLTLANGSAFTLSAYEQWLGEDAKRLDTHCSIVGESVDVMIERGSRSCHFSWQDLETRTITSSVETNSRKKRPGYSHMPMDFYVAKYGPLENNLHLKHVEFTDDVGSHGVLVPDGPITRYEFEDVNRVSFNRSFDCSNSNLSIQD